VLPLSAHMSANSACVLGKTVTVDGYHGLSCRFGSVATGQRPLCRVVSRLNRTGTLAIHGQHYSCAREETASGRGWRDAGAMELKCLIHRLGCYLAVGKHLLSLTSIPAVSRRRRRRRRLKRRRLENILTLFTNQSDCSDFIVIIINSKNLSVYKCC